MPYVPPSYPSELTIADSIPDEVIWRFLSLFIDRMLPPARPDELIREQQDTWNEFAHPDLIRWMVNSLLDDRLRSIVIYRTGLNGQPAHSQAQTGRDFGVTGSRIGSLEHRARARMLHAYARRES